MAPYEGRNPTVKIEPFALERWMTAHELSARYDIAESGILPLSTNDLLAFEEPEEQQAILEGLLETPLGYSEASGSLELRATLANTYRDCPPENTLWPSTPPTSNSTACPAPSAPRSPCGG